MSEMTQRLADRASAYRKGHYRLPEDDLVDLSRRLDALESPTRPLAPPADAEQGEFGVREALTMVMGALTCRAPDRCGGSGSRNACSACRTLPVVEALADRLAPSTHVRTCADCGTRHTRGDGILCERCQSHQDGYAKRCAEEREQSKGKPEPAAEPLTAEDGERERARDAVQDLWPELIGTLGTGQGKDETHKAHMERLIALREKMRHWLLAFARAAPTARATISGVNPEAVLRLADRISYTDGRWPSTDELCAIRQELRVLARSVRTDLVGLNPPATAGGSKNKGEAS